MAEPGRGNRGSHSPGDLPSSQVKGNVYTDYGGQVGGTVWNGLSRTAGTFGVALGSLAYFPAMDMVRQALPMVMSFLKMAMIICIPMVWSSAPIN